ncbi:MULTISPECIES: hypothetical protein, partial [unclassified Achromobacter]|uniref:hypothetical protein n=1 Tax=unclassified Achromobacter TaxID=2626865 RepID=UPI000B6F8EBC
LPCCLLTRFAAFAALLFQQQRNEIMKQFFEVVKFISELFLLLSNAACFLEVTALHLKPALLDSLPDLAETVFGGAKRST